MSQWHAEAGWHVWTEPTKEQRYEAIRANAAQRNTPGPVTAAGHPDEECGVVGCSACAERGRVEPTLAQEPPRTIAERSLEVASDHCPVCDHAGLNAWESCVDGIVMQTGTACGGTCGSIWPEWTRPEQADQADSAMRAEVDRLNRQHADFREMSMTTLRSQREELDRLRAENAAQAAEIRALKLEPSNIRWDEIVAEKNQAIEDWHAATAERDALAAKLTAVESLARNWSSAPHETKAAIDQHLQESYGTTAISVCGEAVLKALGVGDSEEQADA
jgi:hypothetical protein